MKNTATILLTLLAITTFFAQTPQGVNYQIIVKDNNGDPIGNEALILTVTINHDNGTFTETHPEKQTNAYGLVQFIIGDINQSEFINIKWNKRTNISITAEGAGGNYSFGQDDLQSVPFALRSEKAENLEGFKINTTNAQEGGILVFKNNQWQALNRPASTGQHVLTIEDINSTSSWAPVTGPTPIGAIIMWSGTTTNLPKGWALCDGATDYIGLTGATQTVPNLQGKFIVGAGTAPIIRKSEGAYFTNSGNQTYNIGAEGGADEVALTSDEMPRHNHDATENGITVPTRVAITSVITTVGGATCGSVSDLHKGATNTLRKTGVTVSVKGNNEPHENRPPYYVLAYIIKIN